MTVSSPHVIEMKLDRLIDDMRLLRSQMIAFNRQLHGIEAYLKPREPSEQQPESKSRPWFAAVARAIVLTAVYGYRAYRFGVYYGRELFLQFLVLKEDEKRGSSEKASGG